MRKSYDSVISPYNKVGPQAAICRFTSGFTFQPQMRYPVLVQISDPEMFEKIINELRADPDLRNIFADVEKQVEFQELGMDLDIPEDCNMLETELENWEFW